MGEKFFVCECGEITSDWKGKQCGNCWDIHCDKCFLLFFDKYGLFPSAEQEDMKQKHDDMLSKCHNCDEDWKKKKEVEKNDLVKSQYREILKQLYNDSAPTLPDLQKQETELKQLQAQIQDKKHKVSDEHRRQYDNRWEELQGKIKNLEREFYATNESEGDKYDDKMKELQVELNPIKDQLLTIEKNIKDIIDKVGYKRKRIAQIIRLVDSLDLYLQEDPKV